MKAIEIAACLTKARNMLASDRSRHMGERRRIPMPCIGHQEADSAHPLLARGRRAGEYMFQRNQVRGDGAGG